MASRTLSSGGATLHDLPQKTLKDGDKTALGRSAVLVRLNEQVIRDLQQCSQDGKTLRLLAGKAPRMQYGTKTVDFGISPETFQHEIYTSSGSSKDLTFRAVVTQNLLLKVDAKAGSNTSGADSALANLKQSLASFAQEKEANRATISTGVIVGAKGKKGLQPGAGREVGGSRTPSRMATPSSGVYANHSLSASSNPSDPHEIATLKAMERVLLHLLAVRPLTDKEITAKTKIPPHKCFMILQRLCEMMPGSQMWTLRNKSYKELNVWSFNYKVEGDRQKAIDNAVRAFDRQRLAKEDKFWQMLLPQEERGKGKILSRLHSGAAAQAIKDRVTSSVAARSPLSNSDSLDGKSTESKATPKLGPTSTPRAAGMSIEKKLKEAKKVRAAEELKEKKRQEKEAVVASDRETKAKSKATTQVKKPTSTKIKSAELVHDSDDSDEVPLRHKDSVVSTTISKSAPKSDKPMTAQKVAVKTSLATKDSPAQSSMSKSTTVKAPASKRDDTPVAKAKTNVTPSGRSEKHAQAPDSALKKQLSPRKLDTKPRVPSPLGPVRPRKESTVSERSDSSLLKNEKSRSVNVTTKDRAPVRAPQSDMLTKKRPLVETDEDNGRPRKASKTITTEGTTKPLPKPSTQRPFTSEPTRGDNDNKMKRKANDISSENHDHDLGPQSKHRRTESSSTHSGKYSSGSSNDGSQTTTARTSVASPGWQRSPSNTSSSSETARLSWEKVMEESERFRTQYYPAYVELYDRLSALPADQVKAEDRKKLWDMDRRLRQMKKEIRFSSE